MSAKTYLWAVFGFMVVGFGVFIISNYIVDPFQQLRKASWYNIDFYDDDARWLIPGMARNFDYENILAGSSTEENIGIDTLSQIFQLKKPIKFMIEGSEGYEIYAALNLALHTKPNIKTVIYALRPTLFVHDTTSNDSFPKFLYNTDDRLKQVLTYLTSPKTTQKTYDYLKSFLLRQESLSADSCRQYNEMFAFDCKRFPNLKPLGPEHVIKVYLDVKKLHAGPHNGHFPQEQALQNAQNELESLIKSHPQTHFILFYVPFPAILYYQTIEDHNEVFFEQQDLLFPKTLSLRLLSYKNVELHDLRTLPFVTDLNAYYDIWHCDRDHLKLAFKAIVSKKYQLTPSNVQTYTDALKNLVLNYHIPKELLPKTP
ncbi:hypothetical protein HBZS_104170 [Helicobacter bizzozeronii CCUG 35545]|nr:hypothetical protein HBZS_104170 [Helicobacter bizzozeronii CCUG 35545]